LEEDFLRAFEEAKFYGMHIEELRSEAYQTVEGIEFRAITVTAYKGKEGPCVERNQAVIYRGPWKQVVDDDNHVLPRGARIAVCEKTFDYPPPYQDSSVPLRQEIPQKAGVFDCSRDHKRHPRETRNRVQRHAVVGRVCGPDSNCCPETNRGSKIEDRESQIAAIRRSEFNRKSKSIHATLNPFNQQRPQTSRSRCPGEHGPVWATRLAFTAPKGPTRKK
jgi:hypothetical protein